MQEEEIERVISARAIVGLASRAILNLLQGLLFSSLLLRIIVFSLLNRVLKSKKKKKKIIHSVRIIGIYYPKTKWSGRPETVPLCVCVIDCAPPFDYSLEIVCVDTYRRQKKSLSNRI